MTTLGRVLVALFIAAILVVTTVVAAHWFGEDPESQAEGDDGTSGPIEINTTAGPEYGSGGVEIPEEKVTETSGGNAPQPAAKEQKPVVVEQGTAEEKPAPVKTTSAKRTEAERAMERGLAYLEADRLVEAQAELSKAVAMGVPPKRQPALSTAVNRVAERLQFADGRIAKVPFVTTYTVKQGDMLSTIGKRLQIPYPLIMRINGMKSTGIPVGQRLKVIKGPIHLTVVKHRYELQAWLGDRCVGLYPVALGEKNSTPEGTFLVKSKLEDPPYQPQHKPVSDHRPGGAKDNPLGTRWIDLGDSYGIHGTIEPDKIGQAVSEGCVRMLNSDVEFVYDLVVPGVSKVKILP